METSVFRSTFTRELSTIYPAVFEITRCDSRTDIVLAKGAWLCGEDDMP